MVPDDPAEPGPDDRLIHELFPDRQELLHQYVDMLSNQGVARGLIGPRERSRLWSRHILNCAVLAPAFPADSSVADLGSGAGLPGIVLALRRPDLAITLVEPQQRRVTFLNEVVDSLSLPRVEVWRGRAEELHGSRTFDTVTARALAPLDRLARWGWPLVAPQGQLLAIKGSRAAEEIRAHEATLARVTGAAAELLSFGVGAVSPPTTVVRLRSGRQ